MFVEKFKFLMCQTKPKSGGRSLHMKDLYRITYKCDNEDKIYNFFCQALDMEDAKQQFCDVEPDLTIVDINKISPQNRKLIWAKPHSVVYQKEVEKSEIIGKVILKKEELHSNGDKVGPYKKVDVIYEYGIQNYAIYPSGKIKLYIRRAKKNGMYGVLVCKWATCSEIVSLNLDPEYDFGPICNEV